LYRQQAKYGPRRFAATEFRSYTVIKIRSSHAVKLTGSVQRQIVVSALLLASSSVLLLSGCSSALNLGKGGDVTGPSDEITVKGKVHGGQYPVVGSTVTVYEVGATSSTGGGYASTPTVLATSSPTNAAGDWSVSFTCTNSSDEVFFEAADGMGGNTSGTQNTTNNEALTLTVAGGPCDSLFNSGNYNIDEVTTVVTEYALAGFSGSTATSVGTTKNNAIGLTNAFSTVPNLVNLAQGTAYSSTPFYATAPANTTPDVFRSIVPNDLINSLANILATCVNASGGASDPGCTNLFALTPGASTTADAVLYIAHNPGQNVSSILQLATPEAPFGPTLTTTPTDLTMTVNYVGGGLGGAATSNRSHSEYVAIDQQGNIWVNSLGLDTVIELNNQGVPQSPTTQVNTSSGATLAGGKGGYPVAGSPNQIAIDQNGNVWVADALDCLDGLSGTSGAPLTGSPFNSGFCPASEPANGVTVDASNNIWVAGTTASKNYITALSYNGASGTLLSSNFPYTAGFDTLTGFIGADYSGHVWYIDGGNGEYGALTSTGTLFTTTGTLLSGPVYNSAFDNVGGALELAITQSGSSQNLQMAKVTSPPTLGSEFEPNSEEDPLGTVVDGAGLLYFNNDGGGSIPANVTVINVSSGVESSPADIGYTGGSALTSFDQPFGAGVDQSGNLWVLNSNNAQNTNTSTYTNSNGIGYLFGGSECGNLTEVVGLAKPVDPVFSKESAVGTASGVTAAGAYGVAP
jgi:hypothetical protein